ncbi:MAG TPA: GyrI-like domain-containing protein [Pseudonocardiaceae bacterium]
MTTEPEITELPALHYAAIAASVTMGTLGTVVPPLNVEVFGWLAARGIVPAGPPFWRYTVIDMARNLEVAAGCPVAEPVPGDGRVVAGELPAGRYVTLRHVGHPSTLGAVTGGLLDWAAAKGLKWDMVDSAAGERWGARLEIYLTDPATEPDMTKWVTQLAFRLAD